MSAASVNKPESSQKAVDRVIAREIRLAEERGAARVREQLRAAVAEHTRIVRVGEVQVEVVEVAALAELFRD